MTTYNKDQEYTLKVVNTNNEVKEIKYTPNKDMSKPELIMALKSKYKNFFKLIEAKQIKFTDKEEYTAYIVDKDFDLDTLPDDVNYTLVHNLPKTGTKMFLTTRPLTDEERKQFNIRLNSAEVTPEEMRELFSENKDVQGEIIQHRQNKLDDLHSDIRYDFEEAYKDWGNEVSKTKSGFVNEYMSEFCNDFDEVNWRKYIVAIPEVDKIYEKYKDIEDWEIPEDVKTRLYELITDYVQEYLGKVYANKKTEAKNNDPVIVISYGRGMRFPDRKTAIEYYKECVEGTDPNGAENYSYQNILYSLMHTNKDVVYDVDDETEYDWWVQKGKPTDDVSDELLKAHLGENKTMKKEDLSDKDIKELDEYIKTEIRKMYDKYCSENNDKKSFEEWQQENVDSALVNELEYEFFSNRKKTETLTKDGEELLDLVEYWHSNGISKKIGFLDWLKDTHPDKYKDVVDKVKNINTENMEESLDVDEETFVNGFVGQPLSVVLSYIGDGHDIADRDYDSVVFFPPVDEIDDTDNYDLYVQGLSQVLKVSEAFDLDDINVIVDLVDYVKTNKDTLLDLFEVNGETEEEIMEDLVCRVMPLVISGYTTDSVYKILLNTVKGGK